MIFNSFLEQPLDESTRSIRIKTLQELRRRIIRVKFLISTTKCPYFLKIQLQICIRRHCEQSLHELIKIITIKIN